MATSATHLQCQPWPDVARSPTSHQAQEVEHAPEFIKARPAHSVVLSTINALEVYGLDKCLDHGITGDKRYVALALVTRNIHRVREHPGRFPTAPQLFNLLIQAFRYFLTPYRSNNRPIAALKSSK